jgi:hypothetical protein
MFIGATQNNEALIDHAVGQAALCKTQAAWSAQNTN